MFVNLIVWDLDLLLSPIVNTITSVFCDLFWQIRMGSRVWQGGFSQSSAIALIPLSLVKLSLLLNEVDCFCALWNETLLQSFSVLSAFRKHLCFVLK